MWLIDTRTYELKFFHNETEVPYAILSHRWDEEEVTHKEILERSRHASDPPANNWDKIVKCCQQAERDSIYYVWADFCCIDKSSSAELQEAINSMFRWYRQAAVCYAFLSDVDVDEQDTILSHRRELEDTWIRGFRTSEWFNRGWTLQELIAPTNLVFFDCRWRLMGVRSELASLICEITGVTETTLQYGYTNQPCVADIMSWAAGRQTTRVEDRAYSLLGLFGINMPLLYGEGDHAFIRLQEEILRRNDDQSIFAWTGLTHITEESIRPGLLATSPDQFSALPSSHSYLSPSKFPRRAAHAITNEGVSLQLQLIPIKPRIYLAVLNPLISQISDTNKDNTDVRIDQLTDLSVTRAVIFLKRIDETRYARWGVEESDEKLYTQCITPYDILEYRLVTESHLRQVTVVNSLKDSEREALLIDRSPEFVTETKVHETGTSAIEMDLSSTPGDAWPYTNPIVTQKAQYDTIRFYPVGEHDSNLTIRLKTVGLHFDSDFMPVLTFTQEWLRVIARADATTYERTTYTSEPYPHTPEMSLYIGDGEWSRWSDLNRVVVDVRPTIDKFFSGEGFIVNGGTLCDEQIRWGFGIRVYEPKPGGKWHAEVGTYLLPPDMI